MANAEEFYNELIVERHLQKEILDRESSIGNLSLKLKNSNKELTIKRAHLRAKDKIIEELKDELRVLQNFLNEVSLMRK